MSTIDIDVLSCYDLYCHVVSRCVHECVHGQGGAMYRDGSIRKVDGKDYYRFRKRFVSKVTGNSYLVSVNGRTQDECRQKMEKKIKEKEKQLRLSFGTSPQSTSLSKAIGNWLKEEKFGSVKQSTYDRLERTYKNQIDKSWLGGKNIKNISASDIRKFLREISGGGLSDSSVSKVYELLNQFFGYYYVSDMNSNPMLPVEKPKAKRIVGEVSIDDVAEEHLEDIVLSDDEIRRFKEIAFRPYVNGSKHCSKHGVDCYFIMMTALRFGEASALVWRDVRVDDRILVVNKNQSRVVNRDENARTRTKRIITTPKSGKSREVMLSGEALEALEEIRRRSTNICDTGFVLGGRGGNMLSNSTLRKSLNSTLREAGLMTDARQKKFGLHYLRHTGISYYLRNGIPIELVSKMAGHSSVAITERVYYHIVHDQQKMMLDMMDKIKL